MTPKRNITIRKYTCRKLYFCFFSSLQVSYPSFWNSIPIFSMIVVANTIKNREIPVLHVTVSKLVVVTCLWKSLNLHKGLLSAFWKHMGEVFCSKCFRQCISLEPHSKRCSHQRLLANFSTIARGARGGPRALLPLLPAGSRYEQVPLMSMQCHWPHIQTCSRFLGLHYCEQRETILDNALKEMTMIFNLLGLRSLGH